MEPHARRASRLAGCALALAAAGGLVAQETRPDGALGRLRNVTIRTQDVFSDEQADHNLLYQLANLLHGTTRQEVVEREFWFTRGDRLTRDEIEELERNLRALGIFGGVKTTVTPVEDDRFDLAVDTRDRFTLAAAASYSRVGGVNKLSFRLAESNLFGTGKKLVATARYSEDEHNNYLEYVDPQLFGTWHTLASRVGETEEGAFLDLALRRPYHHLSDPWTYGMESSSAQEDVDYYREGETTAEVPLDRHEMRFFAAHATGPREERHALGLDLRGRYAEYEPAFGIDAARWRVPGDTWWVEFGPYATYEYRPAFDEVQRLDAIDFDEDLPLGVSLLARVAARYRDEQGVGSEVQPVLALQTRIAVRAWPETYFTLEATGQARWNDARAQGWRTGLALHAYQLSLPQQTLAASFTFDLAAERQDLVPQFTLGEDNGLRGYPAREFSGSRYARLNLEDRIDTGIEVWSVRLGAAAFCDVGWVHDPVQGYSMSDPIRSVGLGLRLGSSHLFGSRVLRLDVAWPLDEVGGQDYGVSVSFATGQVFTFFGNASELRADF